MALSESIKQIIAEAEDAEKSVQNAAALLEMLQVIQEKYTENPFDSGEIYRAQTYALLASAQALGMIAMELALARKAKTP